MYIRKLIEHLRDRGDRIQVANVTGDLIDRALGELLETEKAKDILLISELAGHWTVPFTETHLRELCKAADGKMSADFLLTLVKGFGGKELLNQIHHNTGFYSHVVVHQG